jgi:hypothetical protein
MGCHPYEKVKPLLHQVFCGFHRICHKPVTRNAVQVEFIDANFVCRIVHPEPVKQSQTFGGTMLFPEDPEKLAGFVVGFQLFIGWISLSHAEFQTQCHDRTRNSATGKLLPGHAAAERAGCLKTNMFV